jgi:predicted nucleic acid-binding protein
MAESRLFYWDSCAFIHLFQNQQEEYHYVLDDIRRRAKNGECKIHTSCVSLAEVCKIPETGMLPIEQTKKILQFFENDFVILWQADRAVCEEAHHLIRTHKLYPMDAIHLATALIARPEMVITSDTKKYRRRGLLWLDGKIGNPPLAIKEPTRGIILPLWAMAKGPDDKAEEGKAEEPEEQ